MKEKLDETLIGTKKVLLRRARESQKDGYSGDANERMFRYHVLCLLEKIAKKPKKAPSAYNLFTAEMIKQGKSLQEVAKLWKEKQSDQ